MLETVSEPLIMLAIVLATSGLTVIHLSVVMIVGAVRRARAKPPPDYPVGPKLSVTFLVAV